MAVVATHHPSDKSAGQIISLLSTKYGFEVLSEPDRLTYPAPLTKATEFERSIELEVEKIDMDQLLQDIMSVCESCSIERPIGHRVTITLPSSNDSQIDILLMDPDFAGSTNLGPSMSYTRLTTSEMSLIEKVWNRLMQAS